MIERSELSAGEPVSAQAASTRAALRWHRIVLAARRYGWIVALTVLLGLGGEAWWCHAQPQRYVSVARMMVSGRVQLPQEQVYSDAGDVNNFYGTQVALMKSPETVTQAIDRVGTIYPDVKVDPLAQIEAGVEPRTSIFDLKVTSTNPEYAKLLLDAVMDTYLASKRGRKNQSTEEAASAITEEISHLDAEIRNDEQELLDFQKQNNVVFIEQQSASSATYLVGLNNELAGLIKEHGLLSLESKDPLITPEDYATRPVSPLATNNAPSASGASGGLDNNRDSAAIQAEQDYIEKLKILRDEYGVYLKDLHPKMVALTDAITKEQKFLELLKTRSVATRDARREDLELQIKNLEDQITVWNGKSLELSERLATYQQLKDKITREQTLYNQLASSIQTVDMNKSLDQDLVAIMEAAAKAKPIDPNYPLQMTYGLLGGLLVGGLMVYFLNRFDTKIQSPLELEEAIDLPILGQIPLVRPDRNKQVPLVGEDDPRHEYVEQFRSIRSALLFHAVAERPRCLMIASAAPGEGKSTLAANLAAVFAHTGARTLLIDADLRRGGQHDRFGLSVSPGLSDYLQGQIGWPDLVHSTAVPNLDFIARGKVPRRPGDLFLGPLADQLLRESRAAYDIVLWDTAPLLAVNDAANLCSRLDGVLLVARIGHSAASSVRAALDELTQKQATVLGVVLNGVEPGQPGGYGRYRYSEYYRATAVGA